MLKTYWRLKTNLWSFHYTEKEVYSTKAKAYISVKMISSVE